MKYLVIEDERNSADLLIDTMSKIDPNSNVITVLSTIQESVGWLNTKAQPDIIFMDIRLEDGISFEIFSNTKVTAPVVFITAYDEYALQAFKVFGAAYLLKPIDQEELAETLSKIKSRVYQPQEDISDMLRVLLNREKVYKKRFLIQHRDEYLTVDAAEIDYIFMEYKTVYLVLISGVKIAVSYTLDELEQLLDPGIFFRANRQFIITSKSIEKIQKYFNEKGIIKLKRSLETEVIISRIKMPLFKAWLDK